MSGAILFTPSDNDPTPSFLSSYTDISKIRKVLSHSKNTIAKLRRIHK